MQSKLFKTIDDNLLKVLKITVKKNDFYYSNEETKYPLNKAEYKDLLYPDNFQLEDEKGIWDCKGQNAFLNLTISCLNFDSLFGSVCSIDSILGIGLSWKSDQSKIKHCIKLGSFSSKDSKDELLFVAKDIEIKDLMANITFKWEIYLVDKGQNKYSLLSYAQNPGMILGDGSLFSIISNSASPMFPIIPVSEKDGPLWGIYYNVTDPILDSFTSENLNIHYNPSHPSFRYIDQSSPDFSLPLFKEFLESSVTALFIELKKSYNSNNEFSLDQEDAPNGSVQQTVKYLESLGIVFDKTDNDLHRSIQLYLQGAKI